MLSWTNICHLPRQGEGWEGEGQGRGQSDCIQGGGAGHQNHLAGQAACRRTGNKGLINSNFIQEHIVFLYISIFTNLPPAN